MIVPKLIVGNIHLIAAAFPGLSWMYSGRHHGAVAHAFVSLVVLAVILGLVAWTFRRKPN